MKNYPIQPIKQKIIYVYRHINYHPHDGWLKIGDQTGFDSSRIIDQNEADNIPTETLYQIPAVDIYGNTFRDYDIHKALEFMGYPREPKAHNAKRKSEWFKVDLDTVKRIIDDRINCRDLFVDNRPVPVATRSLIVLRSEQKRAVEQTYDYWCNRAAFPDRKYLWNAKPRFGKTLTAYKFAEKIQAKRILIVTNRPATSDSWARDYFDHIEPYQEIDYIFAAAKNIDINERKVPTRKDLLDLNSGFAQNVARPLIYFISLQDIKGKSADSTDFKQKNQWIFDLPDGWDLLIIDESHEGVSTLKTIEVLAKLKVDFTLHLSGTPFKAIANQEFSDEQIFNWSYTDEQDAKENWDSEEDNPYAELPRMNFRAYQMSTLMEHQAKDKEACFELSEFFKADGTHFLHEADVKAWLNLISGVKNPKDNSQQPTATIDVNSSSSSTADLIDPAVGLNQPFDTPEKRETLRHTFWFMGRINECHAMKRLLNEHPVFCEYTVVLAAGQGDQEIEGKTMLERVNKAIGEDPTSSKTITLSCGQLTTGVTVKPWTGILMLYGSLPAKGNVARTSATQYLQAAFRAQNPWNFGPNQEFYKSDCYIFDYAPDRALTVLGDYALNLIKHHQKHPRKAIRQLLNYLSVISMDTEGKMRELDAADVVELPRKLAGKEIVDGGFVTSNKLFNVTNIFHASTEARAVINKLTAVKKQRLEKNPESLAAPQTKVDEDGNPIIPKDTIVNTSHGVLGGKKYGTLTGDDADIVVGIASDPRPIDDIPLPPTIPPTKQEDIRGAAKDAREIARRQAEEHKRKEEAAYRDKLRGFARTIPMLLHAYGRPGIKFDNLEQDIADDVFTQVTGITKDEFRTLRQENLFNEANCDAAIKEFMVREEKFANYFVIGQLDDIFNFIPIQEANRVFTPKGTVERMLDMLEDENPDIFKSSRRKFLDPYSKSGLFLSCIVKRLFSNLRSNFKSDEECVQYILANQIYAWSPTPPLRKSTINTVIGFMRFDREHYSQKDKRDLEEHFLNYDPLDAEGNIDNIKVNEHITKCWGENMKFDVIIGNPPYQLNDNGQRAEGAGVNASASPLYHKFINLARNLKPNYISMVVPSRWMVSGKGLGAFRKDFLGDHRIRVLHDYPNSKDVFPNANIDIKGGVCYFLWDQYYNDKCQYCVHSENGKVCVDKFLDEDGDVVIRFPELSNIRNKVWAHPTLKGATGEQDDPKRLSEIVSVRKPYGLPTDTISHPEKYNLPPMYDTPEAATKDGQCPLEIFGLIRNKRVKRYLPYDYPIKTGRDKIKKWKVFVPEAYGCGAIGEQIPSPILGSPIQVCTETFLRYGAFDTRQEAENALKYLKTKFFRCLVGVYKNTQHTTRRVYVDVPMQDFTANSDIDWGQSVANIDQQLYKKYKLNKVEIAFIEEKVKAME